MYESDITAFLRELKQERPHLEQAQQEGRAIWWDHPQDPDTQRRQQQSRLAQAPYVYQSKA